MVITTICTVTDVTCSTARELISARIDAELDAAGESQLDRHLETCASCLGYQEDAFALRRALRMRVVETEPTANVSVDLAGSLQGVSILRWALFVIGGTLVVLNMSSIITPDGGAGAHLDRHNGVFGMALGIGMLAVAAKPHRAIGLVPLTSAIALLMTIAAIADLVTGNANLLAEAVHIVQFAGLICLWVISGGPSRVPKHLEAISRRLPAFHGG